MGTYLCTPAGTRARIYREGLQHSELTASLIVNRLAGDAQANPAGVLAAVGIAPGMEVVDLCSGDGWFTLQIAKVARHVIAIGQMLMSALLIHLTGGRIETHFHVFGSLAILAFYRDWRVLISASAAGTACVKSSARPSQ